MSFDVAFDAALNGADLTDADMTAALDALMSGEVEVARAAAFLAALRVKGETITEIVAAARVMREHAEPLELAEHAHPIIDTCGTGGSGANIFNVSSAVAIVAAAAGAIVAKHGNRAVSGSSGSADVLEAAGVEIELDAHGVQSCIARAGIGFLFARVFHKAMKNIAPVRQAMATRTIFNLLGPLTNPAKPKAQVIGVFSKDWAEPIACATHELGVRHAFVVHADDGLDEISIAAPTHVVEQKDGEIRRKTIRANDFGLHPASLDELRVANADESLAMIRDVFTGTTGAASDTVALNAAAALVVGGIAANLKEGVSIAKETIASGSATRKLDEWVETSREVARERKAAT